MASTLTVPYQFDFGPAVLLPGASQKVNLTVKCGSDWSFQVPFTANDGSTPIDVSSPLMVIRSGEDESAPTVLTPTLTVQNGNTVNIFIPGALSKPVGSLLAYYDLYVTRADTSGPQCLIFGKIPFVAQVS